MKRIAVLMVLFAAGGLCASAQQDIAFKVLVTKGNSTVKSSGDATWHNVRIGEGLKADDELKVEPNSYLGLMHVTGKPYEISSPGEYDVADLASKIKGGSSVLSKYTDFILSSDQEKRNRLAATGAVHRDPNAPIDLYLPGAGIDHVYQDDVTITWEDQPNLAPYHVSFTNLFGDELYSVDTDSSSVDVNLASGSLGGEETILVTVSSVEKKGKSSNQKSLKKLDPDVKKQIESMVTDFQGSVAENTALNEYVLAGFFEDRGLIVDALSAYYRASQMAPQTPYYQSAYLQFLDRLSLRKLSARDVK